MNAKINYKLLEIHESMGTTKASDMISVGIVFASCGYNECTLNAMGMKLAKFSFIFPLPLNHLNENEI